MAGPPFTKQAVHYRRGTPTRCCGKCTMRKRGPTPTTGRCVTPTGSPFVEGMIDDDMLCDRFDPVPVTHEESPQAEFCAECITEPTWRAQRRADGGPSYRQDAFPPHLYSYCFTCAFWTEKLEKADAGTVVAESMQFNETGPVRYHFDPERPVVDDRGGFGLGFGGRRFRIRFSDGRVVETNNLWDGGEIPERFRSRFPVNATIEQILPSREHPSEN